MARSVVPVLLLPALAACASPQPAANQAPTLPPRAQETPAMPAPTALAPTSVLVDGVELHYVERGSGAPVVLVHGSLADYTYWELSDQIPLLAERHRVVAYSRRYNHPNRNPRGADHSPMVEARDLAGLLEQLGTGPVHLVGHSYGAYTALVYALDHPERVRSLVLAEPPIISWLPDVPGGEGIYEGFMAGVWEPLAQAFAQGTHEGLDFTARWYFQVQWEEVEPEWQTLFRRNADEWHALAVSAHTFPKLDYDRVRALAVPTLLLSAGKNAGGFNDLVDGHLERLLPDVERVIIPDVSHEMFLDDRAASARAMLGFFGRH
jgi:non-heme chloroperoxidase